MGRLPKQTIQLSVLARNQTKDSWTWNLAVSGSGKGTRERQLTGDPEEGSWRLDSREGSCGWTAERQAAESWRLDSRKARQHGIGSSDRSQDESDSSSIVEFSLVTHASDSPHMHIVLQYLPLLLVNPKLCSCLFVCPSIFSVPSIVFLCR